MKRVVLALLLAINLLAGCVEQSEPRRIDQWQGVVDQGWVTP